MISESTINGVTTRVIRDEVEWNAMRPDWDELFAASQCTSFSLHFEWLTNWWRTYGAAYAVDGLRIVTVWRDAQCIGAVPLYLGRRTIGPVGVRELRLISTGEATFEETCPDYINLLCLPGAEAECSEAFWKTVDEMSWDRVFLQGLPEGSVLLRDSISDGRPCRNEIVRTGVCPVADLSRGFENYLQSLSSKTRRNARRFMREADRNGAVFELANAANADQFFEDLIRLHQDRWTSEGKPGCFAAARFTEFHRRLVRAWIPAGQAVLARLSHEGQVYGVRYGFRFQSTFFEYQLGLKRTDTGPFHSPGTTSNLLLMRTLAERGVTSYDFLQGPLSSYKQPFASGENQLVEFAAWRPSLNGFVYRSVQSTGRAIRKVLRRVKSTENSENTNRTTSESESLGEQFEGAAPLVQDA
ncbi:MAG: GNAT family N-acetyltransferase [Planctomycetia bacterium]|nr:GNAT family N-acetyltransferase [Planctomycetia bacterium]